MTQQRYRLRISGLGEDEGQIKVTTFQRVLNALLKTAERTARLLATGAGSEKGAKPRWLAATRCTRYSLMCTHVSFLAAAL